MESVAFLYKVFDNHIKGYGHVPPTPWLDEPVILDKIIEVMRDYPNMKYISHHVIDSFEENSYLEPYVPACNTELKIPRGTQTWWLIVYMENR